jgi:FixJ family two-component response regulator
MVIFLFGKSMKHGAIDFLLKPFRDQDILDAIATTVQPDRQRQSSEGDLADLSSRFARLSAREQQVMLLVTRGKLKAP